MLPPGFGKNLQEVLLSRKRGNKKKMTLFFKPVVLVIDGEGIDSFGFVYLVQALVRLGLYTVQVSIASPAEIDGATAYEVISGRNRGRSFGHNM
ncbi:5'-nucleotidase surE [Gossypium arboreum]|uniref:5'-nucleotidase surE n=1 Tax=Gossypium arboreum TaxID=29729 RepID=A0A0B0P0S0_GOSAR|nr:5'-nucleotidase surE [Gossypium arboreum]